MNDPFELLRKQSETDQAIAAMDNLAKTAYAYHMALIGAGFPPHMAEEMSRDFHRLTIMQAYGLKP